MRPRTASQSGPDSRSSTEVSSRNVRSSLGLPVQHLLGQVVQHVAVAAGELRDEPLDVAAPLQRQRRQLQPGGPAFGALPQRRDDVRSGRSSPVEAAQQLGGLAEREAQIGGAQLGQLPARPQSGQRQRRVAAAGQHQRGASRQVVQQELQRPVHVLRRGSGGSRPPPAPRPPPSSARSLTSAVTAGMNDDDVGRRPAGSRARPTPGRARSSAAATCRQNRTGSLSPSSSESQATGRRSTPTQSASRRRLAEPGGRADQHELACRSPPAAAPPGGGATPDPRVAAARSSWSPTTGHLRDPVLARRP